MKGMLSPDFVDEHNQLGQRIRNLEVGVTKPKVEIGGYGRNTGWHEFGLKAGFRGGPDTKVYWRVRADYVHWRTEGSPILAPVSRVNSLGSVGLAGRPSYGLVFLTADGASSLLVNPDGQVYRIGGTAGSFRISRGYSLG
jgi:hypothetical protein